jgi:hypothetical protein
MREVRRGKSVDLLPVEKRRRWPWLLAGAVVVVGVVALAAALGQTGVCITSDVGESAG